MCWRDSAYRKTQLIVSDLQVFCKMLVMLKLLQTLSLLTLCLIFYVENDIIVYLTQEDRQWIRSKLGKIYSDYEPYISCQKKVNDTINSIVNVEM